MTYRLLSIYQATFICVQFKLNFPQIITLVFCLNRASDEFSHQFSNFEESRVSYRYQAHHPLSFWRLVLVGGARSELFRQSALAPFGKEPSPRSVFTAQLVSSGTVSLVFWRIILIGGFPKVSLKSEATRRI